MLAIPQVNVPGADPVLLGFDGVGRTGRTPGSISSLRLGLSSAEKRKMHMNYLKRSHDNVPRAVRFWVRAELAKLL
jgi:hypothetical protein